MRKIIRKIIHYCYPGPNLGEAISSRGFAPRNDGGQKGVSLIELIIYMGLFSILLVMLLQMFTNILSTQLESEATSSVTIDGRYILNRFTYDIRRSNSIITPSNFGASGNTLRVTGTGIDFSYTLSNGNLLLTNNLTSTSDSINSNDTSVSNLSFTKVGTSSGVSTVDISFTLTSKTIKQTGTEVKTFKTAVGGR